MIGVAPGRRWRFAASSWRSDPHPSSASARRLFSQASATYSRIVFRSCDPGPQPEDGGKDANGRWGRMGAPTVFAWRWRSWVLTAATAEMPYRVTGSARRRRAAGSNPVAGWTDRRFRADIG